MYRMVYKVFAIFALYIMAACPIRAPTAPSEADLVLHSLLKYHNMLQ